MNTLKYITCIALCLFVFQMKVISQTPDKTKILNDILPSISSNIYLGISNFHESCLSDSMKHVIATHYNIDIEKLGNEAMLGFLYPDSTSFIFGINYVLFLNDTMRYPSNRFKLISDCCHDSLQSDSLNLKDTILVNSSPYSLIDLNDIKVKNIEVLDAKDYQERKSKVKEFEIFICPITISDIVFNGEKNCGVFVCESICNSMSGRIYLVQIEKNNTKWEIVKSKLIGLI